MTHLPPLRHQPPSVAYFLAMADHQLGRSDEARQRLSKALEQTEQELADEATLWNRRATLQLLRDEAAELINPT